MHTKENKWHAISPMLVSHHMKCIKELYFLLKNTHKTQNTCIRSRFFCLAFHSRIAFAFVRIRATPRGSWCGNRAHSSLLIKIIWVNLLAAICTTLFTATPNTSNLFSNFSFFLFSNSPPVFAMIGVWVCLQWGCLPRPHSYTNSVLNSVRSAAVTLQNNK